MATQKSTTRTSEATALIRAIAQAVEKVYDSKDALARAEYRWGIWSDSVRQDAEFEHGATPDTADLWEQDADYDESLRFGTDLTHLREEVAALAERIGILQEKANEVVK